MSELIPFPGPGVVYDMPAHVYHAIDALSASALKQIVASAKHYRVWRDSPHESTPALIRGTCTHTAALQPDLLEGSVLVAGKCESANGCKNNGRTLSGGRWYCGAHDKKLIPDPIPMMMDENETLVTPIIKPDDYATALAMARAIRDDRIAMSFIDGANIEASFFWIESITFTHNGKRYSMEVPCKARMDIVNGFSIADIKTCECSDTKEFQHSIEKYRYDIQAAWYIDGASKAMGGEEFKSFTFLAVETEATHCVGIYQCRIPERGPEAADGIIGWGRKTYQELLQVYVMCQTEGRWPGYHDRAIIECTFSPWFVRGELREFKNL